MVTILVHDIYNTILNTGTTKEIVPSFVNKDPAIYFQYFIRTFKESIKNGRINTDQFDQFFTSFVVRPITFK